MMQIVKDVSAALGMVTALAAVITAVSKRVRTWVKNLIVKYSGAEERENTTREVKNMLEQHVMEDKIFRDDVTVANNIMMEFVISQCRSLIKDKFYQYEHCKVLPLYEKKTLMNIKELYIDRLHCNSFASLLLSEMETWEVDYEKTHFGECDED